MRKDPILVVFFVKQQASRFAKHLTFQNYFTKSYQELRR